MPRHQHRQVYIISFNSYSKKAHINLKRLIQALISEKQRFSLFCQGGDTFLDRLNLRFGIGLLFLLHLDYFRRGFAHEVLIA